MPRWTRPTGRRRAGGSFRDPTLEWPAVGIAETLAAFWQSLLDLTSRFVIPDWAALVGLLPVFLVLLVLGPLLTLLALVWLVYLVRRPRTGIAVDEGPWPLLPDADGRLEPPLGEPYCSRHRLVFGAGTDTCPLDGEALTFICPKCHLARAAGLARCGNCGLVAVPGRRLRPLAPVVPPPGGTAAA